MLMDASVATRGGLRIDLILDDNVVTDPNPDKHDIEHAVDFLDCTRPVPDVSLENMGAQKAGLRIGDAVLLKPVFSIAIR